MIFKSISERYGAGRLQQSREVSAAGIRHSPRHGQTPGWWKPEVFIAAAVDFIFIFVFIYTPKDLPIGHKDVMSYTEEGHAWLLRRLKVPNGNLVLNIQHSSLSTPLKFQSVHQPCRWARGSCSYLQRLLITLVPLSINAVSDTDCDYGDRDQRAILRGLHLSLV